MRTRFNTHGTIAFGWGAILIALAVTAFASWATHIVWVISALASDAGATFGQMALGAIGAFMPPVGMIHGVMIWFGAGF